MALLCVQLKYVVISRQFFFLLKCVSSLETKENFNSLIHGGTWGYNFYMGTQNGSKQWVDRTEF